MNNLVCYGVDPISTNSTGSDPLVRNKSVLYRERIVMNADGMDTTSILLIVGSIIGFILIVVIGIFIYLHCKKNKEEKEKQLSKGFAMKVLDINEKLKDQRNKNALDAIKKENQNLEQQNEELKKIKEKQASDMSSQDLNKSKEGNSTIGLIRSDEKRLTPSSSLPLKKAIVDNETKLKENYSFLEDLIKSKIQEVVFTEGGGSGTRRGDEFGEKAAIDRKLEREVFRETQNSKQNNSIYEKHKKDIEDHKDVVESEFSFREDNK